MKADPELATVIILSGLGMLALIGLAVLLIIVVHSRRLRHRADMVELRMRHTDEMRQVEREVEGHTLREVGLELHDNVGQLLTSMRLDINALIVASGNNDVITEMKGTIDRAIGELRRLSHTLIAERLRDRPLSEAIEEECKRLSRPGTLEVVFLGDGHEPTLEPDHKVVLYRIFQEALNNAMKHARAHRITVTLSNGQHVRLGIQDNGVGFDAAGTRAEGHGLGNIQRRATLIGFQSHITSKPGEGTSIIISR